MVLQWKGFHYRNKISVIHIQDTYRQSVEKFCTETTLHGLKYVGSRRLSWFQRAFFAISLALVIWGSIYFVNDAYDYWRTSPLIIGADPKPNYIVDDPFPAVTVCNLNQADKTKAQKFSNSSTEYARLQMLCKRTVPDLNTMSVMDWNNIKDFIEEISQDCRNMVIDCKFGSRTFNCSDGFVPIITDEGLCCSFNMVHPKFIYKVESNYRQSFGNDSYAVNWNPEMGYPKNLPKQFYPRTTPGVGQSLGLSLTLNVESDQYFCSSMNSIGFKILLHNPLEIPSLRDVGLLLAPGRETLVRITPYRTTSLPELKSVSTRFRNCYFQGEHTLRNFKYYTSSGCRDNCLAYMLLQNCNCVSYFLPLLHSNDTICSIYATDCVERTRLATIRPLANQTSCMVDCLPSCHDLSYQASAFTTPLSHDGFKISNTVVSNISADYVEANIAVVHMFFSDLTYRADKQKLIFGTTNFMASVGGLMGLFFGFSFISLAEIVYFVLFEPIRQLYSNWRLGRTKTMERAATFTPKQTIHQIEMPAKFTPIKIIAARNIKQNQPLIW